MSIQEQITELQEQLKRTQRQLRYVGHCAHLGDCFVNFKKWAPKSPRKLGRAKGHKSGVKRPKAERAVKGGRR